MFEETNQKLSQNVQVFVRVRPFLENEESRIPFVNILNDKQLSIQIKDEKQPKFFSFDQVFTMDTTQKMMHEIVTERLLKRSFEGINSTILCYGQTTSGKTYTCLGADFKNDQNKGLLPRIIQDALASIQDLPKYIQAKLKISLIQIYNEKIKDLLDPTKQHLKIRQNKSQGIFITNVTEKYVFDKEQALFYLTNGMNNRAVGGTLTNKKSSRSHLMFITKIHQHNVHTGEAVCAKIIIGDLAGSQKYVRVGEEKFLRETKKINTSLSALSKVIGILSEGKRIPHIPYRDSKLTRLLQESLGGNTMTKLIINLSPTATYETIMSLRFGTRAKYIKNSPKVNKEYTIKELLKLLANAQRTISEQNQLIYQLKNRNMQFGQVFTTEKNKGKSEIFQPEEQVAKEEKYKSEVLNFMEQEDDSDSSSQENNSIQCIQYWGRNEKISPLKSCLSDQKHLSSVSSTPLIQFNNKSLASLNSTSVEKPSHQQLKKSKKIQRKSLFTEKEFQFRSKIYHLNMMFTDDKAEPSRMFRSKSQLVEYEETKRSISSECSIEENLRKIRHNLQKIKTKHLQYRQKKIKKS